MSNQLLERQVENQMVQRIKNVIMMLGSGFAFIGNQYVLNAGNNSYRIDLLFTNRITQSLVAVEIKMTEFKVEYAAERNGIRRKKIKNKLKKTRELSHGLIKHDWVKVYQDYHYGAVCFCKDWNNSLMWGHYANGHNGICVGYKINKKLRDLIKTDKTTDKQITLQQYDYDVEGNKFYFLFGLIKYQDNPNVWSKETRATWREDYNNFCRKEPIAKELMGEDFYRIMWTNMFVKPDVWKDEKEVRMIFLGHPRETILIDKLMADTQGTPYIEITEIICGNKVDTRIIDILKNSIPSNSKLKFMRAIPKGGTYECELIEI